MHKLLVVPALFALVFTLAACGNSSDSDANADYPAGVAPVDESRSGSRRARQDRAGGDTHGLADPADVGDPAGDGDDEPAPDGTDDPAPDPGTEPETHTDQGLVYMVPAGWGVDKSYETRVVTLTTGDGVTIAIAVWPGQIGGFERNFLRWVGMAGYAPADAPGLRDAIETLDLGGVEAQWIPLLDGHGEGTPMISVWVPYPAGAAGQTYTWTIKITGDAAALRDKQDELRAWVESLSFE